MTSRDFCYFLQGFFELRDKSGMSLSQVEIVMKHLSMVFVHEIDPSFGEVQKVLQEIHDDTQDTDRPIPQCIDHIKFTC